MRANAGKNLRYQREIFCCWCRCAKTPTTGRDDVTLNTSQTCTNLCVFILLGRHTGLRPTWNYLTFKQSCKSFNPKNHSSDNVLNKTLPIKEGQGRCFENLLSNCCWCRFAKTPFRLAVRIKYIIFIK